MKFLKRFAAILTSCTALVCMFGINGMNEINVGAAESYTAQCKEMLDLINSYRAEAGVKPVKLYINACDAAMLRSQEIKQTFSHNRPDGRRFSTVIDEFGIRTSCVGENIAWCSGESTPDAIMDALMKSEGHRQNILNPDYEYVGIGITDNENWAQLFVGSMYENSVKGDVNCDGKIDAIDASKVLIYYSYKATAPHFDQTENFIRTADVNNDGVIDAFDASGILKYYSMSATGKTPSF